MANPEQSHRHRINQPDFYFPRRKPSRLNLDVPSCRKLQLDEMVSLARQAAGYEMNQKEREALLLVHDFRDQNGEPVRVAKRPNSKSK